MHRPVGVYVPRILRGAFQMRIPQAVSCSLLIPGPTIFHLVPYIPGPITAL